MSDKYAGRTPRDWHIGTMNDALFVINEPPRPAPTDHINTSLKTKVIAKPGEPHSEGWTQAEYEANARLIADAPKLLRERDEAMQSLAKVKHCCLTSQEPAQTALHHIIRLCIDAGVTEKLGHGLEEAAEGAQIVGESSLKLARDRDHLKRGVETLRAAMPVPDKQGIRFGNCWVCYDKLSGWEGEDGPARDEFYKKQVLCANIIDWANKAKAALAQTEVAR